MFWSWFWRNSWRKGSWAWMFKPYGDASRKIGLLGLDPRTLEVIPRLPDGGFAPWNAWILPVYSPMESFFFRSRIRPPYQIHLLLLLYSPAFAVLRPRVGSTFTRLTFVPLVQSRNCWRWWIKLKNTALSGAGHWMAMRTAFPDILRFSFKFGPILVLSFFLLWGFGSAEDWVVLGCITKLFGALHCRAWAVVLLGSGFRTL